MTAIGSYTIDGNRYDMRDNCHKSYDPHRKNELLQKRKRDRCPHIRNSRKMMLLMDKM